MNIEIYCNMCDTASKIKYNYIFMNCLCNDDIRIIDINKYKLGYYNDYLYSAMCDNLSRDKQLN